MTTPTTTASTSSKITEFRKNIRGLVPSLLISLVWLVTISIIGTLVDIPVALSVPLLLLPVLASFVLLKTSLWGTVRFGLLPLVATLILINIVYVDYSAAVLTIGSAYIIHRFWFVINDHGDKFRFAR
jgi:hypothetical protein